jgi:hypothetical protein
MNINSGIQVAASFNEGKALILQSIISDSMKCSNALSFE